MIAAIRDGLPTGVELDEREEAILDLAARQARDVGRAEADIVARGYLVPGSKGQDVINPSIAEVRQSRIALGKLLAQLDPPDQHLGDREKRPERRSGALAEGIVTRRVMGTAAAPPFEDVEFYLEFGQLNSGEPEFTDEQLEAAWRSYGSKIMAEWSPGRPGHRPWAFWAFEFGEEPDYDDRVVFLAERGLLSESEIGALAKARTWKHIDTGIEHVDPKAVELYEKVCEAVRANLR